MRIRIAKHRCIGAGQCVSFAPGYFSQDDEEGLVVCLHETVAEPDEEEVKVAADACPTATIALEQASPP